MIAARTIVLLVAAACASAAQAGGETLRSQVAATLGGPATICRASNNRCPSSYNQIGEVCCLASPQSSSCASFGGGLQTGTFTCGRITVQCSAIPNISLCGPAEDSVALPPSTGITLPPSTIARSSRAFLPRSLFARCKTASLC
jgi:hypothetical protein